MTPRVLQIGQGSTRLNPVGQRMEWKEVKNKAPSKTNTQVLPQKRRQNLQSLTPQLQNAGTVKVYWNRGTLFKDLSMFSDPWLFTVTNISPFSPLWFPRETENTDQLEKELIQPKSSQNSCPLWPLSMAGHNQMLVSLPMASPSYL